MELQLLDKVENIIEAHLHDESFSVEELASLVGLSRSHLHRKLKKLTGKTASELITELRLKKAKELLDNDEVTVSEVAYKVGFNTPSYFNSVYKKHFKVSPGSERGTAKSQTDVFQEHQSTIETGTKSRSHRIRNYLILVVLAVLISTTIFLFIYNKSNVSIAVLPLNNLTGNPENAYFIEGMHDALIGELGRVGSIRVISRTSTLRYQKSDMLMKEIAKELGVNKIVEGSVLSSGDSIRILIQLIDVYPKERHIMAKDYSRTMAEVLSLQSDVVKDIAQNINVKLSREEERFFQDDRQVNPEMYKAYLRGMYHLKQGTEDSYKLGMQYLKEAIKIDPGDPFAYAGLALGYTYEGHGQMSSEESFLHATSAIEKALRLDPTLDEAYVTLSNLYLYRVYDWPRADEAFKKALYNNPNNEDAHAHYAWYHVLFDDKEKAIYHAKQAVMIDPMSASYASWLALLYYRYENFNKARQWAQKALEINPKTATAKLALAWINLAEGNMEEAILYAEMLPTRIPHLKMLSGHIYVEAGRREIAEDYWNELQKSSGKILNNTCYMGFMAAYLGYTDLAFEYLNEAVDNKEYPISYINFYPCTERIRHDQRFDVLLQKLNLPTNRDVIAHAKEN